MSFYCKVKATRDVKVVAVTAFTEEQVVEQAKKAGIIQVIYKPVSYDCLKQVINDYKGERPKRILKESK
jgi:response regulator of citrate/malate metabolism